MGSSMYPISDSYRAEMEEFKRELDMKTKPTKEELEYYKEMNKFMDKAILLTGFLCFFATAMLILNY